LVVHSVSEINRYIKSLLEQEAGLQSVMVRGELSNFKCYSSGHCYFTLKDQKAALKCVMFRSRAAYLKFAPQNGMKVLANGRISVYERDGVYQLYVDGLAPEGKGELAIAFEQLKNRLQEDGLFDASHKQQLPAFPKKIGVVTSLSGAVLRDIYHVGKHRDPSIVLALRNVLVQGEKAAGQIAEAIDFFNKNYPVDVLIVGRGGGSMEDLWPFNEEIVVRAIYSSKIPVISAVGHETDVTLSDLAADVRAATPSNAAELAIPDRRALEEKVESWFIRIRRSAEDAWERKKAALMSLQQHQCLQNPSMLLFPKYQQLDDLRSRLQKAGELAWQQKEKDYDFLSKKLEILNPVRMLAHGYSFVEDSQGRPLMRARNAQKGDTLVIQFADGKVKTIVDEIQRGK
jgi:exodeoxyribonuclease VII large subunit